MTDEEWKSTLIKGLVMAFCWGALVAIVSKVEIKHTSVSNKQATDWIVTKG